MAEKYCKNGVNELVLYDILASVNNTEIDTKMIEDVAKIINIPFCVAGKDVPAYCIVGGNPAKVIRKRFDDEMIELLEKWQWWNMSVEEIDKIVVPILTNGDIEFVSSKVKKILTK